jgi:hypothetical protein
MYLSKVNLPADPGMETKQDKLKIPVVEAESWFSSFVLILSKVVEGRCVGYHILM